MTNGTATRGDINSQRDILSSWSPKGKPQRLRANYHKPHGSRQLYAWYSIGADELHGTIEPCKGSAATLRAMQAIRAHVEDREPIHVILDNLNHHKNRDVRDWCAKHHVELVFTPTYASWANPIEAHFGPLRQFVIANCQPPRTKPNRIVHRDFHMPSKSWNPSGLAARRTLAIPYRNPMLHYCIINAHDLE